MSRWEKRAVCPCGFHTYAPFGELFHVHYECCPRCGQEKGTYGGNFADQSWKIETMKRICHSNVVWWKPWTWGDYYYEWVELYEYREREEARKEAVSDE